jgi:Tol biopolymer transport system component
LVEVKADEQGEFNTALTIPATWPDSGAPVIEADLVLAAVDTAVNRTIATAPFFNTVAAAQPALLLLPAQGVPGQEIQVTGQGFPANTQVALRMSLPEAGLTPFDLIEAESDEAGEFDVRLTIPTEWPGSGAPVTRADLIIAAVDEETGQTLTTAMFLNTAGSAGASPSSGATLPAGATTPGPALPGRIIFSSDRDGNLELYLMATDGSTPRRLTDNPAWDGAPMPSPDGQAMAFVSEIRDSNGIPQDQEIYVLSSNGSGLTNVTNDPALDSQPAWSPDGKQIAFVSTRGAAGPAKAIYVMQADGSDVRYLVADADLPAWSPDGAQIAFVSTNEGQIYVMDRDGGNVTRLTDDQSNDQVPANTRPIWSPDGAKIVFSANRDGNAEIYMMAPDGSEQLNLTNDPASDGFPVWSPDGHYIAFISDRDGDNDVYVMSPGSAAVKALDSAANELLPTWSPDGNYLLFVSDASGSNEDIYLVHVADDIAQEQPGSPLNLTNNPAQDTFPLWLP